MCVRRRWRERCTRLRLYRRPANTIDNIAVGKDHATVWQNVSENVFGLEFFSKPADIREDVGQLAIMGILRVGQLIRHSVKVPRDLVLLFALSLGHGLGMVKRASETVVSLATRSDGRRGRFDNGRFGRERLLWSKRRDELFRGDG